MTPSLGVGTKLGVGEEVLLLGLGGQGTLLTGALARRFTRVGRWLGAGIGHVYFPSSKKTRTEGLGSVADRGSSARASAPSGLSILVIVIHPASISTPLKVVKGHVCSTHQ